MTDTTNTFSFESQDLINFFIRRFKPLTIVTLIGAVVSIIVALSIQPRFKSSVVLFPTHSTSISNDLLSGNLGTKDLLKFGDEDEVEQLLQILHSEEIRDIIVKQFNLMEHYEIDQNAPFPYTALHRKYKKNISFNRTEYLSVQINVLDTDPQMAADVANTVSALIDTSMNRMKKERALLALRLVEKEYQSVQDEMQILQDSIKMLQKLGVNNYEAQAEVYYDAYAQALVDADSKSLEELEKRIKIISDYGVDYTTTRNKLIWETERFSKLKSRYVEAKIDYEQALPHKFVVDKAVRSEKKSKPVRWLIVAVSTLSTFLFAFLMLIIMESFGRRLLIMKKTNNNTELED
jgi:uncharacterized protein involved in exopolysaccharide biosynthesis